MKSKIYTASTTALFAATLMLTGCGKGLQAVSESASSGGDSQSIPIGQTPAAGWEKVEFNGYQSGGTSNNSLVIYIDKVNQSLLLVLPIPVIIPIVSPIEIPELPGAYLQTYTNPNGGGDSLAVSLPLHYIVKGGVFMPNEKLPNGDDLPYVPAGELPGFAIQFPQMPDYRIHLYVGVNVAAVFAELPNVGLPFGFLFPVKNQARTKVIGAIGYVTPKNGFDGGMYLAAQLPPELARVIDDLIRW